MFWHMTGLSATSPIETILDNENFTLEELLDEDEVIQECKALNGRLVNFLREKSQVEQLIRYIVEEVADESDKRRSFKFPFVSCEIFTCEVDMILKTLVEEDEMMNLLFSFLEPNRAHSTLLAGYFSKVVVCLLVRKTELLMQYVKEHPVILSQLVDLIGITSIMEVLIRFIGTDEHIYSNHTDAMQWIEDTNVLEMILEKFNSSNSPEVHANAAETLSAITRYAPPRLGAQICSPSFIERLFSHALDQTRPKSVLVNSLSICISLLDPKRLNAGAFNAYSRQLNHGTIITASTETVERMLDNIGDLLSLLDVSSCDDDLVTTYGKLKPPLGKHRLKIVEFLSVLLTIGSETAEKELVRLEAVQIIINLFFLYPFNNFLHHLVSNIVSSFIENKNILLIKHLISDCRFLEKVIDADKNPALSVDQSKATCSAEGRRPPKIGNIGHLTRISNKLIQCSSEWPEILSLMHENVDWAEWQDNVLSKRNVVENVYQWTCGRPSSIHDRKDSDDDEYYQDRDYDASALANNLSQAFRYGIYDSDDIDEAQGSLERDNEDAYFDDESAEVVISSLRLEDDQESSLFKNSNWFPFEDDTFSNDRSSDLPSSSPNTIPFDIEMPDAERSLNETTSPDPPAWVQWRETPDANGDVQVASSDDVAQSSPDVIDPNHPVGGT